MKTLIFSLALIITSAINSKAASYYWIRNTTGNWNNAASWSTSAGGPGGAGIPSSLDNVFFTGTRNGNCTINLASVTINSITVTGYTGVITITGSLTATNSSFTSGTLNGGIFNLNNGSASFSGVVINADLSGTVNSLTFTGINPSKTINLTLTNGTGGTISGCTFTSTVSITNNSSQQLSISNNTYQSTTTFTNTSSGIILETGTNIYNGNLTANNSGNGSIQLSGNNSTTTYNGNLILNCSSPTGGPGNLLICTSTGNATLASGKTLSIIDNGIGTYTINNFTQQGITTPVTISLSGSCALNINSSQFNSDFSIVAPRSNISFCRFNKGFAYTYIGNYGTAIAANVFEGNTTLTNSGNSDLKLLSNTFNNDVMFTQNSGRIYAANPVANKYAGNIIINSGLLVAVSFDEPSDKIEFIGSRSQTWTATGTNLPVVKNLIISKTGGDVTLNSPLIVSNSATFTNGIINSTDTNYLNLLNGTTISGASNASHVNGPVRKTGNQAFTFPVGNNGIYRPISISAPSNVTDVFTAQFFRAAAPNFSSKSTPLEIVSGCEYWNLDRTIGSSNVFVTLGWQSSDCLSTSYVTNPANLVVAHWNGTTWESMGNGGTTGTATAGTVTSLGAVTNFSPFTLGTIALDNPLPVQLTSFTAVSKNATVDLRWETASELNCDYFAIERSKGQDIFETIGVVNGNGTTNKASNYSFMDDSPLNGTSYYRLRQVDTDGTVTYTSIKKIEMNMAFDAYPNPASDRIYFQTESNVQLLDAFGRQVMQAFNTDSIVVSNLPAGQYFLKSELGIIKKMMIVH